MQRALHGRSRVSATRMRRGLRWTGDRDRSRGRGRAAAPGRARERGCTCVPTVAPAGVCASLRGRSGRGTLPSRRGDDPTMDPLARASHAQAHVQARVLAHVGRSAPAAPASRRAHEVCRPMCASVSGASVRVSPRAYIRGRAVRACEPSAGEACGHRRHCARLTKMDHATSLRRQFQLGGCT